MLALLCDNLVEIADITKENWNILLFLLQGILILLEMIFDEFGHQDGQDIINIVSLFPECFIDNKIQFAIKFGPIYHGHVDQIAYNQQYRLKSNLSIITIQNKC